MIIEEGRMESVRGPDLVLREHPGGYLLLMRGDRCIASTSDTELANCARFVLAIRDHPGAIHSIAHLGGGFCQTAKMLGAEYQHDIYELEPALVGQAPSFCEFIPGRWQDTLTGKYDCIIYDADGSPVGPGVLEAHLNEGGIILGLP